MAALRTGQPTGGAVMGVFDPRLGRTTWMELSAVPLFRPGQAKAFQVFSMVVDITGRKQAEDGWRRKELDLAEAQAIAHMGSWRVVYGEAGEEWTGSEELYRIYGFPPGQQITRATGEEMTHPEDRGAVAAAWSAALGGHGPRVWEHRIIVAGQVKRVRVRVKFLHDGEGRLLEGAGIVEDLTGRWQADAAP
jgi:PAS domain-containing protein